MRERRVNTAIEVVTMGDQTGGPAWQEPGDRHWLPGLYDYVGDEGFDGSETEFTACGVRTAGMVIDRAHPEKLDCEACVTQYVAWSFTRTDRG